MGRPLRSETGLNHNDGGYLPATQAANEKRRASGTSLEVEASAGGKLLTIKITDQIERATKTFQRFNLAEVVQTA